jgi:hypothetical protein
LAFAPKTSWKTRLNVATCWKLVTKMARVVKYSRRRDTGFVSFNACVYCSVCDGVTGSPASCSRRLKPLASPGRSTSKSTTRKPSSSAIAVLPSSASVSSPPIAP